DWSPLSRRAPPFTVTSPSAVRVPAARSTAPESFPESVDPSPVLHAPVINTAAAAVVAPAARTARRREDARGRPVDDGTVDGARPDIRFCDTRTLPLGPAGAGGADIPRRAGAGRLSATGSIPMRDCPAVTSTRPRGERRMNGAAASPHRARRGGPQ